MNSLALQGWKRKVFQLEERRDVNIIHHLRQRAGPHSLSPTVVSPDLILLSSTQGKGTVPSTFVASCPAQVVVVVNDKDDLHLLNRLLSFQHFGGSNRKVMIEGAVPTNILQLSSLTQSEIYK